MLDIICTKKEKTWVILFFEIYKTMLIIFKSENCSYTGYPPDWDIETPNSDGDDQPGWVRWRRVQNHRECRWMHPKVDWWPENWYRPADSMVRRLCCRRCARDGCTAAAACLVGPSSWCSTFLCGCHRGRKWLFCPVLARRQLSVDAPSDPWWSSAS